MSARLWRPLAPAARLIAVAVLGLSGGACSMSYQLDSFFGAAGERAEATGAINPPPGAKPADELPPERDLVFARAAVTELLNRGGKDSSVPWENPQTGARGTVTPLAAPLSQDGKLCQDFLASYVLGSTESWLRGEACRESKGRWAVRALKPWKST